MRILMVRVGAMGDVVHALPAVAALRAARPDIHVDWVVDERWSALLTGDDHPLVDQTVTVPIKAWKAAPYSLSTWRSFAGLRRLRGEYDLAVDLQGTLRSAAIARISAGGAPVIGFASPREPAAARFYTQRVARAGTHVVEMNAHLLSAAVHLSLVPQRQVALPRMAWADEWATTFAGAGERTCLLTARAGWAAKQWSAVRFGQLAALLHARGWRVLVNAVRHDDDIVAEVVRASRGAAEPVICNVAAMIALVRRCELLVGGDTGPTHVAAALGVPVVALFGPTKPERNGPWGAAATQVLRPAGARTSYSRRAAGGRHELDAVSVDEVLEAADQVTQRRETPATYSRRLELREPWVRESRDARP